MNDKCIQNFYNEIKQNLEGEYKIILEPNRELNENWIEYDSVKWEIEENMQNLVNTLLEDKTLTFEEKVLKLYKYICLNYIYDDNVLYFFKRDESDINNIKYIAVDWYGRIIDETWKQNRKKHNRRVCYEFARFYAKSINKLLEGTSNMEAFMVGDTENLHYVVGLTGDDYSLLLDLDDFNTIKDLTRMKLGLTIRGIKILRDNTGKFQKAIDEFNKDRLNDLKEVEEAKKQLKEKDIIKYFYKIVEILNFYKIDSQGFMEYMRAIIENEQIQIEKIWKEFRGNTEKRYVRCLIFTYNNENYLLDSIDKTLKLIDKEKLDKNLFIFNPRENEYDYYGE